MGAMLVITTAGDEEQGNLLARELLARRQAACVNLVPGMRSTYRWQGKICRDSELLVVIKTMASELDAVAATIAELHSYEVPEVLAFDVAWGEPRFLAWLAQSLDKEAAFDDEGEGFADTDEI